MSSRNFFWILFLLTVVSARIRIKSGAVSSLHEIPRFGHTSNVAVLASSDSSAAKDYMDGVSARSAALFRRVDRR